MKKKILFVLIVLVVILPFVGLLCNRDDSRLKEGTYQIQDNEQYPDAYIVVKDETIQFYKRVLI